MKIVTEGSVTGSVELQTGWGQGHGGKPSRLDGRLSHSNFEMMRRARRHTPSGRSSSRMETQMARGLVCGGPPN